MTFFSMLVVGYMLFAPRPHVLAKKHSSVTPTDWASHRFGSVPLTVLAAPLMLWALANYLLEQLIASEPRCIHTRYSAYTRHAAPEPRSVHCCPWCGCH